MSDVLVSSYSDGFLDSQFVTLGGIISDFATGDSGVSVYNPINVVSAYYGEELERLKEENRFLREWNQQLESENGELEMENREYSETFASIRPLLAQTRSPGDGNFLSDLSDSLPISKLDPISASITAINDGIFLISKYDEDSDALYYSQNISAEEVFQNVSTDLSFEELGRRAEENSRNAGELSGKTETLSTKTDVLDGVIGGVDVSPIEELGEHISEYGENLKEFLKKDKISKIYAETKYTTLKLFAKNDFQAIQSVTKFKIPEFRDGYSRHLYVYVECGTDTRVVFASEDKQRFCFADNRLSQVLKRGDKVLIEVKEVSKDEFLVSCSGKLSEIPEEYLYNQ